MGDTSSVPVPQTPQSFPFFCLTFRRFDKIKVIHADPQIISVIDSCLTQWPGGVQDKRVLGGLTEWKLRGTPFSPQSVKDEAMAAKRLCCLLLTSFQQYGWQLALSSDLSRTQDLTTWFLQRAPPPSTGLAPTSMACVSLSSNDKLQLINAPDYLRDPLKQAAAGLVQDERVIGQDYELKLHGYLWTSADFHQGIVARRLLLNMIRQFDLLRFRFYGTVNIKGTADSLFFQHDASYAPGETRYMMLSLNKSDRIRLIDAPADVVACVADLINKYWAGGMQEQMDHPSEGCVEFKLAGYPWNCIGVEACNARLLITLMAQGLVARGWAVMCALDVTRRVNDKAVFVFRSCAPASVEHLCISPSDTDKLRIINGSQQMTALVGEVIRRQWCGVQRESQLAMAYEWKLAGSPWHVYSGDSMPARHLMCMIMYELSLRGWRVVCSGDVSSKFHSSENNSYPIDVHCWIVAFTGIAQNVQQPPPPPQQQQYGFVGAPAIAPTAPVPETPPPGYDEVVGASFSK